MPQRLYSVLKICQRAVGSPRNTPKISNLPVISCTQRPHSVPTTFPRRPYSVHDTYTERKQLLQCVHGTLTASTRCAHGAHTAFLRRTHSVLTAHTQRSYGAHTAFSRRTHSVLTAIISFKFFHLFFYLLRNLFCKHSDLFLLFQVIRHSC